MASSANNIEISPMNVFWRIEQQDQVTTVADVADSLDGKYFLLGDSFYVWMDGPVAADPAPAGRTGIAVAYTANDSAATIAGLIQAAVDLNANFSATVSGAAVTITAAAVGDVAAAVDVDSGFSFVKCREGRNLDLGLLDGDVEVSPSVTKLDITAHQTGTTPIASLFQGNEVAVTTTLQETQFSQLKEFFRSMGGTFTPSGGTEVFGLGSVKQGDNLLIDAARLTMVPVGAANNLSNVTFWLAYPVIDSIVYSGENARTMSVTWTTYNDSSKDSNVSHVCFGDETQAI